MCISHKCQHLFTHHTSANKKTERDIDGAKKQEKFMHLQIKNGWFMRRIQLKGWKVPNWKCVRTRKELAQN